MAGLNAVSRHTRAVLELMEITIPREAAWRTMAAVGAAASTSYRVSCKHLGRHAIFLHRQCFAAEPRAVARETCRSSVAPHLITSATAKYHKPLVRGSVVEHWSRSSIARRSGRRRRHRTACSQGGRLSASAAPSRRRRKSPCCRGLFIGRR